MKYIIRNIKTKIFGLNAFLKTGFSVWMFNLFTTIIRRIATINDIEIFILKIIGSRIAMKIGSIPFSMFLRSFFVGFSSFFSVDFMFMTNMKNPRIITNNIIGMFNVNNWVKVIPNRAVKIIGPG